MAQPSQTDSKNVMTKCSALTIIDTSHLDNISCGAHWTQCEVAQTRSQTAQKLEEHELDDFETVSQVIWYGEGARASE